MLGVGSGALRADFTMIGLDPDAEEPHDRRSAGRHHGAAAKPKKPVTMKTDWFELNDARLQLASYTKPHLPIGVAGTASNDGSMAAGRLRADPDDRRRVRRRRCATRGPGSRPAAAQHGQTVDRRRLPGDEVRAPRRNASAGVRRLPRAHAHFTALGLLGVSLNGTDRDRCPSCRSKSGGAIIGTPTTRSSRSRRCWRARVALAGFSSPCSAWSPGSA